jgi:hypothetical protein
MQRRSFSWVALVGVGLAGVVAVSAATALAARSAASPFEVVATDRYEANEATCPDCEPWDGPHAGTFTSGAPFCESGTVGVPEWFGPRGEQFRRYTCTDGSGSLMLAEHGDGERGEWTIAEGSGRYAGLRGRGTYSGEQLGGDPGDPATVVFRTTSQGFVDADAVAPSVAFTSASATKLRRPSGAYSIQVALSLRDDIEGNTVAYGLRVTEGPEHPRDRRRSELASKEGMTASGSVSTTLRVFPSSKRVRSVRLRLSGSDPAGNEVSLARWLRLPR